MSIPFTPYEKTSSFSVDNLKFENIDDKVVIHGDIEITRSKDNLKKVEDLHDVFNLVSGCVLNITKNNSDVAQSKDFEFIAFDPFANDTSAFSIGEMTIENGTNKIVIMGTLEVPLTQEGLDMILPVQAVINGIMDKMTTSALPETFIDDVEEGGEIDNPFM